MEESKTLQMAEKQMAEKTIELVGQKGVDQKDLAESQNETIQQRGKGDGALQTAGNPLSILSIARAGEILPPWWSVARDAALRNFWKQSDHLSGALYSMESWASTIEFRIVPRDKSIRSHQLQAQSFTRKLREDSEFNQGWETLCNKWVEDFLSQDNGTFIEVIGPGKPDGPITGAATSLASLDSHRCIRTRDPEFPVIYQDTDSKLYKLHHTRVILKSQMPSPIAEMNNVGFCAVSRVVNNAQHLVDIGVYKQEKLGSRPVRQMMVAKEGITVYDLMNAFLQAEEQMDSQGLRRYAKTVFVGPEDRSISSGVEIDRIDLASIPDGFDEQQSTTLGMFAIALAFGVEARFLWPASVTGATKADALIQLTQSRRKGRGQLLQMFMSSINQKFLPPHLEIVFDAQDDEEDRINAELRKNRAERRKADLETGVTTIRTEREEMLKRGEITNEQFEQMELSDDRLDDGSDVMLLFRSSDGKIQELLDLGVDDPLDVRLNDSELILEAIDNKEREIQGIIMSNTRSAKKIGRQILAALRKLRELYAPTEQRQPDEPKEGETAGAEKASFSTLNNNPKRDKSKKIGNLFRKRQNRKNQSEKQVITDDDEPPRGDFEEQIEKAVRPVLREAQQEFEEQLERGEEPDYGALEAALIAVLIPILIKTATFSFNNLEEQLTIFFDPALVQERALAWASNYARERAAQLVETTRNLVTESQALAEDEEIERAEQTFDRAFSDERSEIISLTEATFALSAGILLYTLLAREKLGLELDEFWFTRMDERVCPICEPLHAKPRDVWSIEFPNGPPAHARCRCGKVVKKKIG